MTEEEAKEMSRKISYETLEIFKSECRSKITDDKLKEGEMDFFIDTILSALITITLNLCNVLFPEKERREEFINRLNKNLMHFLKEETEQLNN